MESIGVLAGPELAVVASIWRSQSREIVAAFGGTSMLPAIAPGQKVRLRCGVTPKVGEVAAYILGDKLAVHRVVACGPDHQWLLTWGDANSLPDDPLSDVGRLVGVIDSVERYGKLQEVPAPPRSLIRWLILVAVASGGRTPDRIRKRVALMYRVRENVSLGPVAVARKIMRRMFC